MQLKDIATPCVKVVTPETLLADIARWMVKANIHTLPVCSHGRLVGMVTERNLFMRATAQGGDANVKQVRDIMDQKVPCCYEDQEVGEAIVSLRKTRQQQLYVVGRDGRLAGVVSRGNLARHRRHLRRHLKPKPMRAVPRPQAMRGG